jgi:hypothetical protein
LVGARRPSSCIELNLDTNARVVSLHRAPESKIVAKVAGPSQRLKWQSLFLSPACGWRIVLALATGACFIPVNLQPERKFPGVGGIAKTALAGLFAGLLLLSTALAVSSAHRLSHHSQGDHQGCVLCLFAHGKVTAAETGVTLAGAGGVRANLPSPCCSALFASVDYLLSPGRAPPLRFSF